LLRERARFFDHIEEVLVIPRFFVLSLAPQAIFSNAFFDRRPTRSGTVSVNWLEGGEDRIVSANFTKSQFVR
jgi:hypothetical protein